LVSHPVICLEQRLISVFSFVMSSCFKV
jgi:hypothetical protein